MKQIPNPNPSDHRVLRNVVSSAILAVAVAPAADFPAPAGGWDYLYDGATAATADGAALDGTWSHANGSDEWDGTAVGTPQPGGVGTLTEESDDFLRIQDTGDPRDILGIADPSNRKLYFTRPIADDDPLGAGGFTLSFRARIPTSGLDPIYRNGSATGSAVPYPAGGDGYAVHDAGKSTFQLGSTDNTRISFGLATTTTFGGTDLAPATAGLTMNSLNGTASNGNVDTGEGTGNTLGLNPTEWHEYWITIAPGGTGTHVVTIYLDGSFTPEGTFDVTAGNGGAAGSDAPGFFLGMGLGSTNFSGAVDIDFVAYAGGAIPPGGIPADGPVIVAAGFNGAAFELTAEGLVIGADYQLNRSGSLSGFLPVGGTVTAASESEIFTDPTPPAGRAFYRISSEP